MRTRALIAGAAVAATLAGGALAPLAAAAPARTAPAAAQFAKLKKADATFGKLVRSIGTCQVAKADVTGAKKTRAAAMKGSATAGTRKLRASNVRMSSAVRRLARAASKCGVVVPGGTAPVVVQPGDRSLTTTPGAPGAPGTPGTPGTPGAPGTPGSSSTSITLDLPIGTILDGLNIDLSAVLGTGVLPQVISLVPDNQLTSPVCTAVGASCVGIDSARLGSTLTTITNGIPLVGPLVGQVTAQLGAGNLSSLFTVTRVSDKVVKIVPKGPLAAVRVLLGSLSGAPTAAVGHLRWVG